MLVRCNYWDYITFEKVDKDDKTYYICYTTSRQMPTFEDAIKKIFAPDANKIRTISINTSRPGGLFLCSSIN